MGTSLEVIVSFIVERTGPRINPDGVASLAGSLYLPCMTADISSDRGPIVILFYKPYGVISQFTESGAWKTLADFGPFPETVYPAGRLDADSEGLLLLTDDSRIKRLITEPRYNHPRTYLVQVERVPGRAELRRLKQGVVIEGRKTREADVMLLDAEPDFPPRPVPVRFRKTVPTAWLQLTITEGRNRQVRKMTAAVGHPALRLVRTRIGNLSLEGLSPGEWRRLREEEVRLLSGVIPRRITARGGEKAGPLKRGP